MAQGSVEGFLLVGVHAFQLAQFFGQTLGRRFHFGKQIVGIHHGSLPGFHPTGGKVYHAVAQVHQLVGPGIAQFFQDQKQDLEVVILFVAHHVGKAVDVEIFKPLDGGTQILGHVDGGAVLPKHDFLVQAIRTQVNPHGSVLFAVKYAQLQAAFHVFLAQDVGVALVVVLVKRHAQAAVRFFKPFVHPAVHGSPQVQGSGVAFFPFPQQGLGLLQNGRLGLGFFLGMSCGFQGFHFLAVGLVKGHVVLAHQVIALHSGRGRGFSVAHFLPGHHALANVDAAVVDDLHLKDGLSGSANQFRHAVAQQVVAYMTQVQRLVGIGG